LLVTAAAAAAEGMLVHFSLNQPIKNR